MGHREVKKLFETLFATGVYPGSEHVSYPLIKLAPKIMGQVISTFFKLRKNFVPIGGPEDVLKFLNYNFA